MTPKGPIIFLNSHRAKSGMVLGQRLSPGYVLASKFFDCGIIDRSHALEVGFDYKVLDEIPALDPDFKMTFAQVCDAVAADLVAEARRESRKLRVLWSGGIDSTVALIALLRALPESEWDRLQVRLSMLSINEYPLFFRRHILRRLDFRLVKPPITEQFGGNALIVTGEHGDQLFGSDKLLPLLRNGLAYEPYEDVLPLHLMHKFGSGKKVDQLIDYLQPLFAACPTPLATTVDLFWWLNFTIKWQQVSLRLPVFTFREEVQPLVERFRHFFRDVRFQRWALANYATRVPAQISDYKLPAKQYIHTYTGDADYLGGKTKQPSLKHVLLDRNRQGNERYRVVMTDDYRPSIEVFHKKFRNQKITQ